MGFRTLDLYCMDTKFGIVIAARIPMIATTIISSTSVKPLRLNMFTPVINEKGWMGCHQMEPI